MSIVSGQFPSDWKRALLQPLFYGLELSYSNLRLISHLQYVSKLVEGAATQQILQHLNHNSLFPSTQSAYRQFRSTETTLLRIKNDIIVGHGPAK